MTTETGAQFPIGEEYDRQRILLEFNHLHERIRDLAVPVRTEVRDAYTALLTDELLAVQRGSITVTLPEPPANVPYKRFTVKDESGDGDITVAQTNGKTIDGNATTTVGAYAVLNVYWNGENYFTR